MLSNYTQHQINNNINNIKIIKDKVSHLLMPVRYFKKLNILPRSLVDEEIINKNFDEKWLHKTYFETNNNCHIKNEYHIIYDDYIKYYRSKLNEVLEYNNFPINSRVEYVISKRDFIINFDIYVKEINFDLSPYYIRYFENRVYELITEYTNRIDKLTNGLTIEDLQKLTEFENVVFKNRFSVDFSSVLVKICPKTIKWRYINDNKNYILKKNDFINDMPYMEFAILLDEGEHTKVVINKTNINNYILNQKN